MNETTRIRKRRFRRHGFTLAELAISVISTSVLMAGLASSIFIASRAASSSTASNATMSTSLTLADLVSELAAAKSFSERTSTAVTFKVTDRDADTIDETVRYFWSGQAGSPLLRYYNGTAATAVDNVHHFALAYTTRSCSQKRRILFVRGDVTGTRASYDRKRRDLLTSWGFQVLPFVITASTTQSEIDTYLGGGDAVYISSTVTDSHVGTKLNAATIGIVVEKPELYDSLRLYFLDGNLNSATSVKVENTNHPATTGLSGPLQVVSSSQTLVFFDDDDEIASGAIKLCKQPTGSTPTMIAVERGAALRGATAAGRRITVPWGTIDFNPNLLTTDGQNLLKGALAWATYDTLLTGIDITLQTSSSGTAKIQTQVEIIGRPAL